MEYTYHSDPRALAKFDGLAEAIHRRWSCSSLLGTAGSRYIVKIYVVCTDTGKNKHTCRCR